MNLGNDKNKKKNGDKRDERTLYGALTSLEHRIAEAAQGINLQMIYSLKPSFIEFLERFSRFKRRTIKMLFSLALFLLVAFAPLGLEYKAQIGLAIFVGIAALWTTEALPLPITALLVPVLLTAFGIFETDTALRSFSHPVVFLLLGGVILARAIQKHGLDKRLLYPILLRSQGKVDRVLLYFMFVAALLSMWISNTATVAIMAPLGIGLGGQIKDGEESKRLSLLFLLGLGMAAGIGGMGTVTGTAPNAITSALIAQQQPWTFLDWMIMGLPVVFILLFIVWRMLLFAIPTTVKEIDLKELEHAYEKFGPMKDSDKKVLYIFFFTVTFWILGAEIGAFFNFPASFMSAAIVSLLAAVALFATDTLEWTDVKNVPYGVFLIIGAGLALGEGLISSGAADWIASNLEAVVAPLPVLAIALVITFAVVGISNFLNNTASAAIFIPIFITLASSLDMNIKLLVLPAALGLSLSFITPIGTPPITLIYSTGRIPRKTLAKVGAMVTVPAALVCVFIVFLFVKAGVL